MNAFIEFFYELLTRPLYNALVFLADVIPGGYLSLAIITLTIVIRLILLGPAGAAIRSQRAMQIVTPELDKVKKKYAGDQQKIAAETMALFKKHNVNPFGGCLPILIQLPILWAFFWVLKLGVGAENSPELYSFISMPENLNTTFLWVKDITQSDKIWLPILVAAFQFMQMKTISWRSKKKQSKAAEGKISKEQNVAQNMMSYVMPVMIGFIARGLSAGLSLYWISTSVFSTVQQIWMARNDKKNS